MNLKLSNLQKKILVVFFVFFLFIFSGCQKKEKIDPIEKEYQKKYVQFSEKLKIDKNNIINIIDELSSDKYTGRQMGTPGEAEASLYLAKTLKDLGISPYENEHYFHNFYDSVSKTEGENVLGILKNPDRHKYIILSANYDHLGIEKGNNRVYPGANKNASGVASIIEMARVLSKSFESLDYNIVFAFWSGHENNLAGSKAYLESLNKIEKDNIALLINLDTIGTYGSKNYIIWKENDLPSNLINEILTWRDLSIKVAPRGEDNSDHFWFADENIPSITIRSEDWRNGSGTIRDDRYGVNIENVRLLSQNLVNYIYNLKEEDNV